MSGAAGARADVENVGRDPGAGARRRIASLDGIRAQLLVTTPIVIAVAWLFGELFERPFTGGGVLLPRLAPKLGIPVRARA